jgi:hypothetical protein
VWWWTCIFNSKRNFKLTVKKGIYLFYIWKYFLGKIPYKLTFKKLLCSSQLTCSIHKYSNGLLPYIWLRILGGVPHKYWTALYFQSSNSFLVPLAIKMSVEDQRNKLSIFVTKEWKHKSLYLF